MPPERVTAGLLAVPLRQLGAAPALTELDPAREAAAPPLRPSIRGSGSRPRPGRRFSPLAGTAVTRGAASGPRLRVHPGGAGRSASGQAAGSRGPGPRPAGVWVKGWAAAPGPAAAPRSRPAGPGRLTHLPPPPRQAAPRQQHGDRHGPPDAEPPSRGRGRRHVAGGPEAARRHRAAAAGPAMGWVREAGRRLRQWARGAEVLRKTCRQYPLFCCLLLGLSAATLLFNR